MTHPEHLSALATGLLLIGLILRYCIGQRRFKRRNGAGLQQFRTYSGALMILLLEKLINGFAALLLLAAVILYLLTYG